MVQFWSRLPEVLKNRFLLFSGFGLKAVATFNSSSMFCKGKLQRTFVLK